MSSIERIRANTVEVGDCWEWIRSYKDKKTPVMNKDGSMKSVRREVWELTRGKLGPKSTITYGCGNFRCVCPDHLKKMTKSAFMAQVGMSYDRTMVKRADAMIKQSLAMRKLTDDQAEEIRASDLSCKKLAEQYGVSHSVIHDIKRYRRYVPKAANIWRGLMR